MSVTLYRLAISAGIISILFLVITIGFIAGGIAPKEYELFICTGVTTGLLYGVIGIGYMLLDK